MTPELKSKLKAASVAKRMKNPLLKDVDPLAILVFACDEFDTQIGDDSRSQWGYLSRAPKGMVGMFRASGILEFQEAIVGGFNGSRIVTCFKYQRLRFALEKLGVHYPKYLKSTFGRHTPATRENIARYMAAPRRD